MMAHAVAAASVACFGGSIATAQTYQPLVIAPPQGAVRNDATNVYGGYFMPGRDIVVDQLGYFDYGGDGLLSDHKVGLWYQTGNGTGRFLVDATVAAGTASTLEDGYRWIQLATPITLRAGQYYVIGAEQFAGGDPFLEQSTTTFNPDLVGTWSDRTRRARWGPDMSAEPMNSIEINASMYGSANLRTLVAPNMWNGASGSGGNWGDAGNWAGGAAPGFGAGMVQLTFGPSARTTANNNIGGASLRGIEFLASAPAMTLTGNGFTTIGGIMNNSANAQVFATGQVTLYSEQSINARAGDITFSAPVDLGGGAPHPSGVPTLQVVGLKTTTFNQSVQGSGNLVVGGAGSTPRVVFNADNGFTGSVAINSGVVKLNSSLGLGDPGTLNDLGTPVGATTVGVTGYGYGQLQVGGNIDSPETLVLPGRDTARNFTQHVLNTDGNNTLSGMILLSNGNGVNHFIRSEGGTKLTLTGMIGLTGTGAHYLYFTGDGDSELALAGSLVEGSGSNKIGLAKQGRGTLTISSAGDAFTPNTWTNGTFVLGGKLVLDRTADNRDSINGANNPLTLYGGTLVLNGNAGSDSEQVVKGLTVSNGQGQIVVNPGTGRSATVRVNQITRTAGGTLNVTGSGTVTTTTANNAGGMLGAWATVNGTDWATNAAGSGEGAIVAVNPSAYTPDTWGPGLNTDVTSDANIGGQTTGTLRFNAAGARTLTLSGDNSTSAILVTPNVGGNQTTINGGTLRGLPGTGNSELITHVFNTDAGLTIGSVIADNAAANKTHLVKAGPGTLTLTAANTFTGPTTVGYGTLRVANAAALASSVVTVWSSDAALALDTNASVGGLAGYGAVDIGSNTLTVTGTGEESFHGTLSGTGGLVIAKTGAKGLNMHGGSTGFAGQITVNDGARYYARGAEALGNTAAGTTVNSGGLLYLMSNMDISEPMTLSGSGVANVGALRIYTTQTITSRGPITLTGPSTIHGENGANFIQTGHVTGATGTETLSLTGDPSHSALTISGNLNLGSGGVNVQNGNWFLQGDNTYSGPTSLSGNGIVTVSSIGTPGGAPSNLGQPSASNADIMLGAVGSYPQLVYTGTGESTARGITMGSNGSLVNGGGKLTFNGPIALNPGTLVLQGSGDVELTGAVTSTTGVYAVNVGANSRGSGYTSAPTVTIEGADGSGATATATVSGGRVTGVVVTNYGTGFTGRPTVTFSGGGGSGAAATAVVQTGSLLMVSTGTWTLSGPAAIGNATINHGTLAFSSASDQSVEAFRSTTGTGLLRKSNTGTLTAGSLRLPAVAIDGGTLRVAPDGTDVGTVVLSSLALSGPGTLDLTDNDMVLNYVAGSSPIASVRAAIAAGYNGGLWNGAGIISSSAAGNPNGTTGLAAVDNADLQWTTFSGQTVTNDAVLVMYTFFGDANLDGTVNADDYSLVDRGLAMGRTGWMNGDFDYSGTVNSGDYLLMDRAFSFQSGGLSPSFLSMREAQFGADYVAALAASVPEPSAMAGIFTAGVAAAGRRRRVQAPSPK
jgi:autotransporter-associated beta strand protein